MDERSESLVLVFGFGLSLHLSTAWIRLSAEFGIESIPFPFLSDGDQSRKQMRNAFVTEYFILSRA